MKNTYRVDEADVAAISAGQIKRLLHYLKPYRKQVMITIALMFTATLTELIGPLLLQRSVDVYIPTENMRGLLGISLAYLGALGFSYFCTRAKIRLAHRTGQNALLDLRKALFNHVQSLSFNFFGNIPAGKLIVRIVNDIDTLNNLFTNGIVNVFTELSMLFAAAVMMFVIHPRLAMVTLSTVPIFMALLFITRSAIKREWRFVRKKLSNLNAYIHESIAGMKVVQAYVRQRENDRIFHTVLDDVFNSWMRAIRINSAYGPAVELISVLGTVIIFWYGARLLAIDDISVGVVIAFTVYLRRFWQPVMMLTGYYNQLLVAMASSERIFELMDEEPEIAISSEAIPLDKVQGSVEFANVTFSYEEGQTVLHNTDFQIEPGETIAIVGPTGSGKTTIISLLSRFYDPLQGKILIDGQDLKNITLKSLRENIGIMLQDPFIFRGTILDNIRYGRLEATEEEIIEVAKAVHVHDFIGMQEKGYHTEVNERGSNLSIGQRQLICFARVLLADPSILILDEATASVDTHTELLLQKAIDKLLEGRTSFVIAHRLSTIRNADRIMVINKGRIAEMGSHEQLVNNEGLYHQLYTVQYKYLNAV